jgi:hypothetical protein
MEYNRPKQEVTISDWYFKGVTPEDGTREFRRFAKKVWYEHVKRRPEIDKKIGRQGSYTLEEQRIINTPIDLLLADTTNLENV